MLTFWKPYNIRKSKGSEYFFHNKKGLSKKDLNYRFIKKTAIIIVR